MTAAVVALAVAWVAVRRGARRPEFATAVAWVTLATPVAAAACAAILLATIRWRRAAGVTRERRRADEDVVLLADLLTLGVAAGRTVRGALEAARTHLHPQLGTEVTALLGDMDRRGSGPAMLAVGGRLADLGRVVAAAATSGAPVAAAVAAHADRVRHARHSARIAAARRLPVRLLLPLALLILPGFVVLAVGPAVLQALARLSPIP
jgi:hypothetical protein